MQNVESAAKQVKELVQHALSVLVVTRSSANTDGLSAALALAESLRAFGRAVHVATPGKLPDHLTALPGAQHVKTEFGRKSFVISLDYQPGSIAKISYGPEGNKYNVVITPADGTRFTPEQVNFSYSGSDYDLVFVVDTADLALLGDLYEAEKEAWSARPLVNIDRHPANTQFGKVNVVDHEGRSTAAIVFRLLEAAKLPLNSAVAELLLLGLREATDGFAKASPDNFEQAARLSRVISGPASGESTEERLVNEPFRKGQELSAT